MREDSTQMELILTMYALSHCRTLSQPIPLRILCIHLSHFYPCTRLHHTQSLRSTRFTVPLIGVVRGGYQVIAVKRGLSRTEHRDRPMNKTSRVNVAVQWQSFGRTEGMG